MNINQPTIKYKQVPQANISIDSFGFNYISKYHNTTIKEPVSCSQ
jgi:hypothetical protein